MNNTANQNIVPDLADHDSFRDGPPLAAFKWMRHNSPLHWSEGSKDIKGFWSLTRQPDIIKTNANFRVFSSAHGIRLEDQTHEEYLARRTFQETDPPEHTSYRRMISGSFSKLSVEKFAEPIAEICQQILDQALESKEFDAVQAIARPLPMRMLGRILGTPDSDSEWLVGKGDELISNSDPDYTSAVVDELEGDQYKMLPFRSPAGLELYEYAQKQLDEQRRAGRTDSLILKVLEPTDDGRRMTDLEFRNFFCLLVAAGNDTTRYSIASTLHRLANQPGLIEQLRDGGDDVWFTAPDELVRIASPAMYFRRTATCDFEMHDQIIKEGDKVVYWFISGNRDETVFENPEHVDVFRKPNRHVAFGMGGPHICLGMWLAKLEITILFKELVKRIKTVEQVGAHKYLRSNFVHGIKRLPLRITPF